MSGSGAISGGLRPHAVDALAEAIGAGESTRDPRRYWTTPGGLYEGIAHLGLKQPDIFFSSPTTSQRFGAAWGRRFGPSTTKAMMNTSMSFSGLKFSTARSLVSGTGVRNLGSPGGRAALEARLCGPSALASARPYIHASAARPPSNARRSEVGRSQVPRFRPGAAEPSRSNATRLTTPTRRGITHNIDITTIPSFHLIICSSQSACWMSEMKSQEVIVADRGGRSWVRDGSSRPLPGDEADAGGKRQADLQDLGARPAWSR